MNFCPTCHGVGQVRGPQIFQAPSTPMLVQCPTCLGSGVVVLAPAPLQPITIPLYPQPYPVYPPPFAPWNPTGPFWLNITCAAAPGGITT